MNRRWWQAGCALVVACTVSMGSASMGSASTGSAEPAVSDSGPAPSAPGGPVARGPVPGEPWVVRQGKIGVPRDVVSHLCENTSQEAYDLVMPLFGDVELQVTADLVVPRGDQLLITGHVVGGTDDESAHLVFSGACSDGPVGLSGVIRHGVMLYELTATDEGYSLVQEIDLREKRLKPSSYDTPPDKPTVVRSGARTVPRQVGVLAKSAVVDVAVGYTSKALAKAGGLEALKAKVAVAESQINDAFQSAGVKGKVKFIHFFEADYTGSEDASEVMDALDDASTVLGKQAREVREAQYADLVSVLSDVPKGSGVYTSGIANTPREPRDKPQEKKIGNTTYRYAATDDEAWSVVDVVDTTTGTMAHELGHNFALWHDDKTLDEGKGKGWAKNPVFPYNRGWVTESKKQYSIMAYGSSCDWKCTMAPRYSSPTETAGAEGLGDDDHDNARVLRQTVPVVARYRTPPVAPDDQFDLALSASPTGGGTADAAQSGPYDKGTKVSVVAEPSAGYVFDGWRLDGKDAGKANPIAVTMDAEHALVAVFKQTSAPVKEWKLTTGVTPSGAGSVKASAPGPYTDGTAVSVTARAAKWRALSGWQVDGKPSPARNPLRITMNRDHAVTARFDCAIRHSGAIGAARNRAAHLGCAVTPQHAAAAGGQYQNYEKGAVYWSSKSGAHPLWGAVHAKWRSLRAERGALGYPVADPRNVVNSRGLKGVCQNFQRGVICWSAKTGAHAVLPPILAHWKALGGVAGKLGFPTTDVRRLPGGRMLPAGGDGPVEGLIQGFQGGDVIHDSKSGKATVQPH